jgi:hypothetical protein
MSRITHEPGTGSITEQRPHTSLASDVTTQASRAGPSSALVGLGQREAG